MAVERTLSIIKPDAVAKNVIGKIYSRFETNGLKVVAARMAMISNNSVPSDGLGPHDDLLGEFPYLGTPHANPPPPPPPPES